ncbi:MAG: bifunctional 23S rRNA (guanine(2069)-N(7))-methyltransferase RlmK/23S rRNA (guanine(2445)-N(2))-methyltransferase RlmL, partial [Thermodesulfobacteriota bacterium]
RLASRVLWPLASFSVANGDDLYDGCRQIPWEEHFAASATFAVAASGRSQALPHSGFAALRVKDAVADRFRDLAGRRPDVDPQAPDIAIDLHVHRDLVVVSLDLSGPPLHERGYRQGPAAAPLKENLAAAILARSGWPELAAAGAPLVDLCCGSGTLAIEGALIALRRAPGLLRPRFGFERWLGHQPALWVRLLAEARDQARPEGDCPVIVALDRDGQVLQAARDNAARAGVEAVIRFQQADVTRLAGCPAAAAQPGLVVANPPYGQRLGERQDLSALYQGLGESLRRHFAGWQAAILTAAPELGQALGLSARRVNRLRNGPLECQLLRFAISPEAVRPAPGPQTAARFLGRYRELAQSPGAQMLANRLRKSHQHLSRWARRQGVHCYRLYDADIPEYALAVDLYSDGEARWLVVQEYEAPPEIDPERAKQHLREAMVVLPDLLGVDPGSVFLKIRRRQKGHRQYPKLGDWQGFHQVREAGLRFWVNFTDYLDTGLFLDHRPLRQLIGSQARGKHFLNLFAYTGAATVHAAAGGAAATLSVDLSATYLTWLQHNLAANGLDDRRHRFVQADVLAWLDADHDPFDLILLDPPTFSTSKRMTGTLDVLRDHKGLLARAMALLAPGGLLYFSTNHRRFRLDPELAEAFQVEDISRQTIDQDFRRHPKIHQVWTCRHRR